MCVCGHAHINFNLETAFQTSFRCLYCYLAPTHFLPILSRDLSTLAAAVHKQKQGSLKVLDLMSGSGIRSARYLKQAGASLVHANDLNPRLQQTQIINLLGPDLNESGERIGVGVIAHIHASNFQSA